MTPGAATSTSAAPSPALQALQALQAAGLEPGLVLDLVRRALDEDLGADGDLTSAATVPDSARCVADYVARRAGVIAGLPVLAVVLEAHLGSSVSVRAFVTDGAAVTAGTVLATVAAPTRQLLEVERTSLNLVGHLSGIATVTRRWVEAVAGTGAQIRDTRKTTPGLRSLEKYAVRCGGGVNHRTGLFDAVLIKDNHVLAAGGVGAALESVRSRYGHRGDLVVQVEVDTLAQLDEALAAGATDVLLDNMDVATLTEAVRRAGGRARLEASGGLTLDSAPAVAATGVDFLAVGALTHSAPALDIALDLRPPAAGRRESRRTA